MRKIQNKLSRTHSRCYIFFRCWLSIVHIVKQQWWHLRYYSFENWLEPFFRFQTPHTTVVGEGRNVLWHWNWKKNSGRIERDWRVEITTFCVHWRHLHNESKKTYSIANSNSQRECFRSLFCVYPLYTENVIGKKLLIFFRHGCTIQCK